MRRNLAVAAVLMFSLAPALAQTEPAVSSPRQQQPGLGDTRPGPELKAARKAMRQACMQDIRALCAGSQPGGGKVMMCLRSRRDQVSDGCKAATRHLRNLRRGALGP